MSHISSLPRISIASVALALWGAGCSGSGGAEPSSNGGKSAPGSGGSSGGVSTNGGTINSGGGPASSGGASQPNGGAAAAAGGASAGTSSAGAGSGGTLAAGGSKATGGSGSANGGAANAGAANGGAGASNGGTSSNGGKAGSGGAVGSGGSAGAPTCPSTYSNPIIWEDLPDVEVIRVDDTFYYTASTFHYSPGAPVLRSFDLVNWEYFGHSVPVLDFGNAYSLVGGRSYVNGIWASSLRYRKSNDTFYWIGCLHGGGGGAVFTAPSAQGPWTKHATSSCYYDVGLLIDDDDTMYVAYGNTTLNVAQLSKDGFSQVKSQQVFDSPSDIGALEGSRLYKINNNYYIFTTQYANGEYVLRSTSGPFGPYTLQPFAVKLPYAGAGAGASPHQGGIVDTPNGDWYYIAFNDSYPAGRIPVMAPITWTNGWPSVNLVSNRWGDSYPFPKLPCGAGKVKPMLSGDTFASTTLGPEWEWNHNPDNTKWSTGSGLVLQTATVTSDLYAARNTLTHRIPGPTSTATIELDYSEMKDGDVAGLAALRDSSAWVGVKKASDGVKVVMVNNLTLDANWNTSAMGTEVASASVTGGKIWLRVAANIRTDSGGGQARFYYSTDGSQFTQLGSAFTMKKEWQFFLGYRYGIFNYATTALGGKVTVSSFQLVKP